MSTMTNAILNTLAEFGPLTSCQLADYLGTADLAAAIRELDAAGAIYRNAQGAWDELVTDEADPGDMDGDAASALASCGWGTDEDYGYAGEDY